MMKKTLGFTLLEVLVALGILACLGAASAVGLESVLEGFRWRRLESGLTNSLKYARAQALSLGRPVTVCASNNQLTCQGRFSEGVLVFIDQNHNHQRDESETILRQESWVLSHPERLSFSAFGNTGKSEGWITFSDHGDTLNNGHFEWTYPAHSAHHIIIRSSGMIRKEVKKM